MTAGVDLRAAGRREQNHPCIMRFMGVLSLWRDSMVVGAINLKIAVTTVTAVTAKRQSEYRTYKFDERNDEHAICDYAIQKAKGWLSCLL